MKNNYSNNLILVTKINNIIYLILINRINIDINKFIIIFIIN